MKGKEKKGKIYIIRTKDKAGAYKYSNVVKKLSASAKKAELKIKNIKGDYPCNELFGKDIKSRIREVLDERDILGEIKGEKSVWVFLNETILSPLGMIYTIHVYLAVFIAAVFKLIIEYTFMIINNMRDQDISKGFIFIIESNAEWWMKFTNIISFFVSIIALLILPMVLAIIPFAIVGLFDRFVRGIFFNAYKNEDFLLRSIKFISIILLFAVLFAVTISMLNLSVFFDVFMYVIAAYVIYKIIGLSCRLVRKIFHSLWMRNKIICVVLALAAIIALSIFPRALAVILPITAMVLLYLLVRIIFWLARKIFFKGHKKGHSPFERLSNFLARKLRKKLSKNYFKYRKYKRTYDIFIKFLLVYILFKVMDTVLNYSNSLHETANQLL